MLAAVADQSADMPQGPRDRLHRRKEMSYFNPSPAEILAATRVIQTEWTEHERTERAGFSAAGRRWRVPQVRVLGAPEVQ